MIIITEENYKDISKASQDYAGIVLERIPHKKIEKKILDQMKHLDCYNINNYIELLKSFKGNSRIMDDFISEITISESYIFRNPKQFEFMLNNFLPSFFEKTNYKFPLRIWSAGCSEGEEAYSIAMIAKFFQQKHNEARFTINAGDINKNSLQKAKAGIYGNKSLRGNIQHFENLLGFSIGKYDAKENCIISSDLKEMVDFQWLNLKNINNLKIMSGSDIIFCRNVLIYFEEALRNKLLEIFFEYLNPGGLLFIGESECFPLPPNTFETLNNQGSYAYRKPEK